MLRYPPPPPWRCLLPHTHKLGEQSRVPRAVHPAKGERKYTAEDYALAAKRGEIYDSEEGFFGA